MSDDPSELSLAIYDNNLYKARILLTGTQNKKRVNVDGTRGDETTPLWVAVIWGRVDSVRLLLEFGADVNVKDTRKGCHKNSLLHEAVRSGVKPVIRVIVNRMREIDGNVYEVSPQTGFTALEEAIIKEHWDVVECLIQNGVNDVSRPVTKEKSTLLHGVVYDQKPDNVARLLKYGADTSCRDINGSTPLLIATQKTVESTEVLQTAMKIIRLLVPYKNSVSIPDNKGRTPLHCAAKNDCPGMVWVLLHNGADLNAVNRVGKTPNPSSRGIHIKEINDMLEAEPLRRMKIFEEDKISS
jgi:ankyrin repeat protein